LPRTRFPFARLGSAPGPLAALAGLGLMLAALVGCSNSSSAPAALVSLPGTCLSNAAVPLTIVVGERSNVPNIQFPAVATSLLDTAGKNREPITLIRIDGKPTVFRLPLLNLNGDVSSGAVQQDLSRYVSSSTLACRRSPRWSTRCPAC
jgi:hypothetical protein